MARPVCRLLLLCFLLTGLIAGVAVAQQGTATKVIKTLENNTTTGTQLNHLAKIVSGPSGRSMLVKAAITDTAIDLYVVFLNAGTTGSATIMLQGEVPCVFDQTNAAVTGCGGSGCSGKYVVESPTTPGQCRVQQNPPSNGVVVGKLVQDSTTAGQVSNILANNQAYIPGTHTGPGTVTSVGMTVPLEFAVAPATITGAGVFHVTKATASANCVMAGPTSGAAAVWACRPLVAQDLAAAGVTPGTCTGDLGGTYPTCTVLKASTTFALAGETSQTVSGTLSNYANCPTTTCRLNGGAADVHVTGFQAPLATGDLKAVCNVGTTHMVVLEHQDAASTAANQLFLTDDVTVQPGACHLLRYDTPGQRWRSATNAVPDYLRLRSITLTIGDVGAASPALGIDNDSPKIWTNMFGRPFKVLGISMQCTAGSTSVLPSLESGTALTTAACTCSAPGVFTSCALSGTPIVQPTTRGSGGATCPAGAGLCRLGLDITAVDTLNKYVVFNIEGILQ